MRHKILRPSQPSDSVKYPADQHQDAAHFGAYLLPCSEYPLTDDVPKLIGALSIHHENMVLPAGAQVDSVYNNTLDWRIRGMAVDTDFQRKGIGALLLQVCYKHLHARVEKPGLWCNARSTVLNYYSGNGFEAIGEEFDIPDIGPHFVMVNQDPRLVEVNLDNYEIVDDPSIV